MKSVLSAAALTVASLLLFTCPATVSAEMLGQSYMETMTQIQVQTKVTVATGQLQYKHAVRSGNKKRIKLAAPIMKHAMVNYAVAGDLVVILKKGGKIKRKHAEGCRSIASGLTKAIGYFAAGKFRLVETAISEVNQIILLQPQPVRLNVVLSQFNVIQQQISFFAKTKGKGKKGLKNFERYLVDAKGSKIKGSKRKGSVKVKGSSRTVIVVTPPRTKGSIKVKQGSRKSVECVGDPGLCWKCSEGKIVPDNTEDPGLSCTICEGGYVLFTAGSSCDDGSACTKNDTCVVWGRYGFCEGQSDISPVTPCN